MILLFVNATVYRDDHFCPLLVSDAKQDER